MAEAPIPEEFRQRPDNEEPEPPIYVGAAYYRDGELVHDARRTPEPRRAEEEPGWTVQGGAHGQTA